MVDYKKMYIVLCAAADEAISALEQSSLPAYVIADNLRFALLKAEEIYTDRNSGDEAAEAIK